MTRKPCILHISKGSGIGLKVVWGCRKTILQSLAGSLTWKRVNLLYSVANSICINLCFYSGPNLKIPFFYSKLLLLSILRGKLPKSWNFTFLKSKDMLTFWALIFEKGLFRFVTESTFSLKYLNRVRFVFNH